jgi:exodeoxyribonuclease V gamma subunit
VHLLLTNPSRYYWGDLQEENQLNRRVLNNLLAQRRERWQQAELQQPLLPETELARLFSDDGEQQGNPLLVSLGKQGRDYLALLAEISAAEIDAFAEINSDSLLHLVQQDLLELQDGTRIKPKRHITAEDRSLVLHGCHSPLREVEVLHDQLLQRFGADANLTPKDVVVMVADINRYGPYIQAVFGSAAGECYIPFSLSASPKRFSSAGTASNSSNSVAVQRKLGSDSRIRKLCSNGFSCVAERSEIENGI